MKQKKIEQKLFDYLDDNMSEAEKKAFEHFLNETKQTDQDLKAYRILLQETKAFERKQAPDHLWSRIEAELDSSPAESRMPILDRLQDLLQRSAQKMTIPTPVIQIAGVAALLLIGFFIGRQFTPQDGGRTIDPQSIQQGEITQVAARTEKYIEKSKILLLGIVNSDESQYHQMDMSGDRELAEGLITEASYLKDNLDLKDNARLRQLVQDLELTLLEIANLEETSDIENIELIKGGIESRNLLLKINLHALKKSTQQEKHSKQEQL